MWFAVCVYRRDCQVQGRALCSCVNIPQTINMHHNPLPDPSAAVWSTISISQPHASDLINVPDQTEGTVWNKEACSNKCCQNGIDLIVQKPTHCPEQCSVQKIWCSLPWQAVEMEHTTAILFSHNLDTLGHTYSSYGFLQPFSSFHSCLGLIVYYKGNQSHIKDKLVK